MTTLIFIFLVLILVTLTGVLHMLCKFQDSYAQYFKNDDKDLKEFIRQGFIQLEQEVINCFALLSRKVDDRLQGIQGTQKTPRRLKPSPSMKHPRRHVGSESFEQAILAALPEYSRKPLHYTRLAGRLKCTHGRVSGALSRLLDKGLIERTGQGLYRKCPGAEENVDGIDISSGSVDS